MVENYKPIYLPTMQNIKLTDKEREMLSVTYCGLQWLLENADEYSVEVADAIENDIIPRLRREI